MTAKGCLDRHAGGRTPVSRTWLRSNTSCPHPRLVRHQSIDRAGATTSAGDKHRSDSPSCTVAVARLDAWP